MGGGRLEKPFALSVNLVGVLTVLLGLVNDTINCVSKCFRDN